MSKKAFTLIELLAVILILGIIALIAIPVVNNIIYQSRKMAFKETIGGVVNSIANKCNTETLTNKWNTSYLTIDNGSFSSGYDIGISGKLPDSASAYIGDECKVAIVASDSKFCAIKDYDEDVATVTTYDKDTCILDDNTITTAESCFVFNESTNTITGYNFSNSNCGTNVTIPEAINNIPVYYIEANSFNGTSQTKKIEYVNFSKAVHLKDIRSATTQDEGAFANNEIVGVSFGNLKELDSIGNFAFYNNRITEVTLPEGLTKLYSTVFGNNYISSVKFPTTIKTIGNWSFRDNQLSKVTIPESVTSIEDGAFYNNVISSANIPQNITDLKSFIFAYNQLQTINIPASTTSIGNYAFVDNSINNINIPSTVTYIGDSAFENNFLSSVSLPNVLTNIGSWAFKNNSLSSINLSNAINFLGMGAFYNNNLTSVTLPTGISEIYGWTFDSNNLSNIIIPNNIVTIGNYAFAANKFDTLTLGTGLTTIGNLAFTDNNLQELYIPNNVVSIASDAFNNSHLYLTFNIDKVIDGILYSPWGAGYSKVNWLK